MPIALPRSSPVGQHVDPAGVLAFLDALEARPDIEMHSVMLVRHGHVVAEGWWAPYSADRPHLLYSLSKSFTSTAAAFAAAEGLLDLDDTEVDNALSMDVGMRGWTVSTPADASGRGVPVAAAGGWSDSQTLGLEVIFLETPHQMDFVCSLDDRCATAAWRLPPLGGFHLQNLHSPT